MGRKQAAYSVVEDAMAAFFVVLVKPDVQFADSHGLQTGISAGLFVESDEHLPGARALGSFPVAVACGNVIQLLFQLICLEM
jgi:hypothetical protein